MLSDKPYDISDFLHYQSMCWSTPSISMCAWNQSSTGEMGFYQLKLPLSHSMQKEESFSAHMVTTILEDGGLVVGARCG